MVLGNEGLKMNCKIHETCPQERNCSVIAQAEFCAYHQHNYSSINNGPQPKDFTESNPRKLIKLDLDFFPDGE
jgi:hypothetical protein